MVKVPRIKWTKEVCEEFLRRFRDSTYETGDGEVEYIKEDQILLYEELYKKPINENDLIVKATIRFRENIRLAPYIVKKLPIPKNTIIDEDDMLQEAYLGLWKSCLEFNEMKDYKFSTYAFPTVYGYVLKMLRENELIRTPRWYKDVKSCLNRYGFSLPLKDSDINTIVAEGVFSREKLLSYVELEIQSLDTPVSEDGNIELYELIADSSIDFYEIFTEYEVEYMIDEILNRVNTQRRDIVKDWLYSIAAGEPLKQKELAAKYRTSRTNINKIVHRVLRIMKEDKSKMLSVFGY